MYAILILLPLLSSSGTENVTVNQCYTGNDTMMTCSKGQKCCYGLVQRLLHENETTMITQGGCWHDPGRCNAKCDQRYDGPLNISLCQCNTSLCNLYITWREPTPRTTEPAPIPPPPRREPTPIYQIVLVVVGCLVFCFILGFAALVIYKKYISKNAFSLLPDEGGEDGQALLARLPNGKAMGPQYERQHEIEILRDIGFGRYGQVQQAKVGDSFIAIKKFSPSDRQSFVNELMIMTEKRSPHLLSLLGYLDNPLCNQLWLLIEYMPLGNMSDYLRNHTLSIPQSLHLLSSFISGICYLHSEPQPVAHRDIKTRNVLMLDHKTAKLADFGLALLLDYGPGGALNEKAAPPTQVGTTRYMAPEVLEGSMFYREAEAHMRIDVYAASLVMWEVMWRTQLDQRDQVPPYLLPFERQLPEHPTTCEMQALVAVEKQRPELRAGWANHAVFNKLEVTLTESWDNDENARLSSKTIQARILPLLSNESDSEVSI